LTLAPIALFVYNRPIHTRRMVESLCKNPEYLDSPITVYCDGPKNDKEKEDVISTRKVIRETLPNVSVVEHEKNTGLANSIIKGVSEQCNKHGRVIVIEDDLLLSPVILRYFNEALDYYESNEKVMHISAYMYPVNKQLPSSFFYRETSCWGWATWGRAWKHFEPNGKIIADYIFRNNLSKKFNVNNSYLFWEMLLAQDSGRIDSWAIRWYGSVFMKEGLALSPGKSLIQNTGFDGTGINCNITGEYEVELSEEIPVLHNEISECKAALHAIIEHRSKSYIKRILNNIKHYRIIGSYLIDKLIRTGASSS